MRVNAPIINQRTQIGNDGKWPEDGNNDCVPASLSSLIRAFYPADPITADGLHDLVYGQGYIGEMNPNRFISAVAAHGARMAYVSGSPLALVMRAASEIAAGHGVILSIPSDWGDNPPTSQFAHMVAGCDTDGATWITCMNPWTAQYERYSFGWWAERLLKCAYQGIWILQRNEVQAVWHQTSSGASDDKGHAVGGGLASAIFAHGWQGSDGLTSEEAYDGPHTFVALSNGGVINWDGAAHIDQAGQVLAQVWQQSQTAQSQLANANNQLTGANATITQLQAEIAALKAQQPPAPPASDPLAAKALATLQDLAATLKEM